MPSLADKLRQYHGEPAHRRQDSAGPAECVCYHRVTSFPLQDVRLHFSPDVMALLRTHTNLPLPDVCPETMFFLDTETTGLSGGVGTCAFLVGVGCIQGKTLYVHQYLMRDYNEERDMLQQVLRLLSGCRLLFTFNGKSFDLPLLHSRATLHHLPFADDQPDHIGLLYPSRRVWKMRLQRCTLSQLEKDIFHSPRQDDLPGAQVPEVFFTYLKKKDFSMLEPILMHNALDIATLPRLMSHLCSLHEMPLGAEHTADIYSLGKILERRRKDEEARQCFRACESSQLSALARAALAENWKRNHHPREARAVYEHMIRCGQAGPSVYIALSKLLEHKFRDNAGALRAAQRGLNCFPLQALNSKQQVWYDDLMNRCIRLSGKLQAQDTPVSREE